MIWLTIGNGIAMKLLKNFGNKNKTPKRRERKVFPFRHFQQMENADIQIKYDSSSTN